MQLVTQAQTFLTDEGLDRGYQATGDPEYNSLAEDGIPKTLEIPSGSLSKSRKVSKEAHHVTAEYLGGLRRCGLGCGNSWRGSGASARFGRIFARPNGFGVALLGQNTRQLTIGEKVYITKIDVHTKNDKIMLTIVECDPCNGVQQPTSYKSAVVFQFPKDYLSKADPSQIKDVISLVLAPDASGQQQEAETQQEQAPDQTVPPPQTIQLGQTIDQVKTALGQPEKIVDLGQKQIYVYKDLKITFVNGKVADVQ
jgi:hypothetical protein